MLVSRAAVVGLALGLAGCIADHIVGMSGETEAASSGSGPTGVASTMAGTGTDSSTSAGPSSTTMGVDDSAGSTDSTGPGAEDTSTGAQLACNEVVGGPADCFEQLGCGWVGNLARGSCQDHPCNALEDCPMFENADQCMNEGCMWVMEVVEECVGVCPECEQLDMTACLDMFEECEWIEGAGVCAYAPPL